MREVDDLRTAEAVNLLLPPITATVKGTSPLKTGVDQFFYQDVNFNPHGASNLQFARGVQKQN